MALKDVRYADLPEAIKNNLTPDQFEFARIDVVEEGEIVPETTEYIDLASGIRKVFSRGERAPGDLLPTHDLSGAHGKDYSQWEDVWPER